MLTTIQRISGAKIQIEKINDMEPGATKRIITITGLTKEAVTNCRVIIEGMIQEYTRINSTNNPQLAAVPVNVSTPTLDVIVTDPPVLVIIENKPHTPDPETKEYIDENEVSIDKLIQDSTPAILINQPIPSDDQEPHTRDAVPSISPLDPYDDNKSHTPDSIDNPDLTAASETVSTPTRNMIVTDAPILVINENKPHIPSDDREPPTRVVVPSISPLDPHVLNSPKEYFDEETVMNLLSLKTTTTIKNHLVDKDQTPIIDFPEDYYLRRHCEYIHKNKIRYYQSLSINEKLFGIINILVTRLQQSVKLIYPTVCHLV